MTSASTYLIDATGADPVLVPAEVNIRDIAYVSFADMGLNLYWNEDSI